MATENPTRKAYLEAMGLKPVPGGPETPPAEAPHQAEGPCKSPTESCRQRKALDRAHSNRELEINLYWRRSAYYWAFQAAVFAALGLIFKDKWKTDSFRELLAFAFCGVGLLTAVAGLLAAKGSKFWQENWELHVDMLERDFEGNLYKTLLLKHGRPAFSVSGVNLALHRVFICFWALVGVGVCALIAGIDPDDIPVALPAIVIGLLCLGALLLLYNAETQLDGRQITPGDGNAWQDVPEPNVHWYRYRRQRPLVVIRRRAPGEGNDTMP